jgi:hypothetical protein
MPAHVQFILWTHNCWAVGPTTFRVNCRAVHDRTDKFILPCTVRGRAWMQKELCTTVKCFVHTIVHLPRARTRTRPRACRRPCTRTDRHCPTSSTCAGTCAGTWPRTPACTRSSCGLYSNKHACMQMHKTDKCLWTTCSCTRDVRMHAQQPDGSCGSGICVLVAYAEIPAK